jgi:hypothetical protein
MGGGGGGGGSMADLFGELFGGGGRGGRGRERRSDDVVHKLAVALEDLYTGTVKCGAARPLTFLLWGRGRAVRVCCLPRSRSAKAQSRASFDVGSVFSTAARACEQRGGMAPAGADAHSPPPAVGARRKLSLARKVQCGTCSGTGSRSGRRYECNVCRGSGIQVHLRPIGPGMVQQIQARCSECNGSGSSQPASEWVRGPPAAGSWGRRRAVQASQRGAALLVLAAACRPRSRASCGPPALRCRAPSPGPASPLDAPRSTCLPPLSAHCSPPLPQATAAGRAAAARG